MHVWEKRQKVISSRIPRVCSNLPDSAVTSYDALEAVLVSHYS